MNGTKVNQPLSQQTIVIDGSEGEGGGQIVRNAITYACILQKPVKVHSIRGNREKPGLKAQHKTGLQLAVNICGGILHGADVGSDCIEYHPAREEKTLSNRREEVKIDSLIYASTGTAGSICLLLQVGIPCALFARREISTSLLTLSLEGGTNTTLAPQIDYLEDIFLPVLSQRCLWGLGNDDGIEIDIVRRGYFPIGGGIVKCSIPHILRTNSHPVNPIVLTERGKLKSIHIKTFYGGKVPWVVANHISKAASDHIKQHSSAILELSGIIPTQEIVKHLHAKGSGAGIIIIAKTSTNCIFGASAVGTRKIKPQQTGKAAAIELFDSLLSGGCVDDWLSDQLILFMALAKGESKVLTGGLTLHTRSAIQVASAMTDATFEVEKIEKDVNQGYSVYCPSSRRYWSHGRVHGRHLIKCTGAGFHGT